MANDYEKRVYQAVELFNEKKFQQALEKFNELAQINPNNIKVHEVLCQIHTQKGNFDLADKEFEIVCQLLREKGVEVPPKRTFEEVVEELESEEVLSERYNSVMEKGSKDALGDAGLAVQLAMLYMKDGRYQEAEKIVQKFKDHCVSQH